MPPVTSLLLDHNEMVKAALELFGEILRENQMSVKDTLRTIQTVGVSYACLGVKKNGGDTSKRIKEEAVAAGYKSVAAPGFLKWLEDEAQFATPTWVADKMGNSTMTGNDEKYYKDGGKLYKKHMEDFCIMRRDWGPIWDKIVANQPDGSLPSGEQYPDRLEQFLDAVWKMEQLKIAERKKAKAKSTVVVDVDVGAAKAASVGPTAKRDDGVGSSSGEDGGKPAQGDTGVAAHAAGGPAAGELAGGAGEGVGVNVGGGGSEGELTGGAGEGVGVNAGGDGCEAAPAEPAPGTPAYAKWLAQQAAKQVSLSVEGGGDGTGDETGSGELPERPKLWMHYLTLAFCFFGRPAGDNEDVDLRDCKEVSGPPGPRRTRAKKRASASSSSDDSTSSPVNRLGPQALHHLVGAGAAQSRAKIKREQARMAAEQSNQGRREAMLRLMETQAKVSGDIAGAVLQVAADAHAKLKLDEEEARRKRKKETIDNLKGELEFASPVERPHITTKLRSIFQLAPDLFTAGFDLEAYLNGPPLTVTPATSAATPAQPGMYGGAAGGVAGGGGSHFRV